MHSPNSPCRPVPIFDETITFSSKRDLKNTPRMRVHPPRPPAKSTGYAERAYRLTKRASFVSQRKKTSSLSRLYDDSKDVSYFEQCYQIIEKIGSGSFADVFKVRSKSDGQLYAIKKSIFQYRGIKDRELKLQEVFKQETLHHPNIVRLHRAWEENCYLYLECELCEKTLSQHLYENCGLSEDEVCKIFVDLLMALKHIHDNQLLHLDIKPDNAFISGEGIFKLGDFGLVVDLQNGKLSDAIDGDSRYLAAEVIRGEFSKAADIFSLGMTVFECITDFVLPSDGQLWHSLRSHLSGSLIPSERCSPELRQIIQQMLHPDPEKRPSTDELVEHPYLKSKVQSRQRKIAILMLYSTMRSTISVLIYHLQSILSSFVSPFVRFLKPLIARYQPPKCTPPHPMSLSAIRHPGTDNFPPQSVSPMKTPTSEINDSPVSGRKPRKSRTTTPRPVIDSFVSDDEMDNDVFDEEGPEISSIEPRNLFMTFQDLEDEDVEVDRSMPSDLSQLVQT